MGAPQFYNSTNKSVHTGSRYPPPLYILYKTVLVKYGTEVTFPHFVFKCQGPNIVNPFGGAADISAGAPILLKGGRTPDIRRGGI